MTNHPSIAPLDMRIFLKYITGCSDADLICTPQPELSDSQNAVLQDFVSRRMAGEPVSKIIGHREFYGLDFVVNADVLDPRPDTETLVDVVLAHCKQHLLTAPRILECGVGSGCISVALLKNMPHAQVVGVDISSAALETAQENVAYHNVSDRCRLILSDWYDSVEGQFDIIVSNPPYIESKTIESLEPEVKNFDPIQALDGGNDGLDAYKNIFAQAKEHLYPHGVVILELGAGQEVSVGRLIDAYGFAGFELTRDLSGTNRVLCATL